MIEFWIEGIPHKRRPRTDFRSGRIHTPHKNEVEARAIAEACWAAMKKAGARAIPAGELVEADILVVKRPARAKVRKYPDGVGIPGKPDLDNVAKAILDALNQVAFDDDAQVAILSTRRIAGDSDRVRVRVRPAYPHPTDL